MARMKCLPFCHWPTFGDPCDGINVTPICCIKFTMPCAPTGDEVELSYDGFTLLAGSEYCMYNTEGSICSGLSGFDMCQDVAEGAIPTASGPNDPDEMAESIALWYFGTNMPNGPTTSYTDTVGYDEQGCEGWPENLTELSGLVETELIEEGTGGEVDTVAYRRAIPCLRWRCVTGGQIYFEAGWNVYKNIYGPISVFGSGGVSRIFWDGFFTISAGYAPTDWYTRDDPFLLEERYPDMTAGFQSTVTPVFCNYEPCGEPLDCFVDCISGSVNCDGVTPAHSPIIYFTLAILGCCLNGTHRLTYSATGTYGAGYYGTVTCDSGLGATHTLDISVKCCVSTIGGDTTDVGPLICLILDMTTLIEGFPPDYWQLITLVTMSCTSGVLAETSGTISDSDCGFGSGGWVIHG